jgi:hypothetical protein
LDSDDFGSVAGFCGDGVGADSGLANGG